MLQAFTAQLRYPAGEVLKDLYVHYVADQFKKEREHFYSSRKSLPICAG